MTDAWATVAALGSSVPAPVQTALKGALLAQNPVFAYPSFQPVERTAVASGSGVVANVAETSVDIPVPVPRNTSAVLYLVAVNSTATAAGTVLDIQHKRSGLPAGSVEAQVLSLANWGQIIADVNSGQCTYKVTKNSSTSYSYNIYVVGFFRSY